MAGFGELALDVKRVRGEMQKGEVLLAFVGSPHNQIIQELTAGLDAHKTIHLDEDLLNARPILRVEFRGGCSELG